MAWDWRHAVDTSKPDYYRWTQWLLVRFFEAGLLYQAEAPVTWCPSCLTVLAREQTETVDGVDGVRAVRDARGRAGADAMVPAHHRLRRPAARRPGRPRLAGPRQAPPAPVDRPQRGPRDRLPHNRFRARTVARRRARVRKRRRDGLHDAAGHDRRGDVPGGAGRVAACGDDGHPPPDRRDVARARGGLRRRRLRHRRGDGRARPRRARRPVRGRPRPAGQRRAAGRGHRLDRSPGGPLPAAGLVDLAPALLGPADPDRPLRRMRARCRARGPAAGRPAGPRRVPADRAPACRRWRPARSSSGRPAPAAAQRRVARPTSPTRSSTRRGTSCATPPPTSPTTVRGTTIGPGGCCPSTSTPVDPSTCSATTCTPGS